MTHSATTFEPSSDSNASTPPKPTCTIVIAYDDYTAGQRAMNIFNHLSRRFTQEFEFRCKLWRFDVLDAPAMLPLATRDAVDADLVVLSAGQCEDLPPSVRTWIESWSPAKLHGESALVFLSNRPHDAAQGARSPSVYLREVAQRSGMEFFGYHGSAQSGLVPAGPRLEVAGEPVRPGEQVRLTVRPAGPVASGRDMGYSPTMRVG